jgi:hypothetical protein
MSSPPNGGAALAGTSGRKTANPCETNTIKTATIVAAYFIVVLLLLVFGNRAPELRKTCGGTKIRCSFSSSISDGVDDEDDEEGIKVRKLLSCKRGACMLAADTALTLAL